MRAITKNNGNWEAAVNNIGIKFSRIWIPSFPWMVF